MVAQQEKLASILIQATSNLTSVVGRIEKFEGLLDLIQSEELEDPALDTKNSAKYLATTEGNLRLSRHTGVLFGKPAPPFLDAGGKKLYRLSVLNDFLGSLKKYKSTAELPPEKKQVQIRNLGKEAE